MEQQNEKTTAIENLISSGLVASTVAVGILGFNYLRSVNSYNKHIEKNLYGKCIEDIIDIHKHLTDVRASRRNN